MSIAKSRFATTSQRRGNCVRWRQRAKSRRKWAIRVIARRAIASCANTSGPARSAKSPRLIAGPTAPTVVRGRVHRNCLCPPACIGTNGSGRRLIAISTMTSIHTNGMAGMISATAPSATWVVTCLMVFIGRSRSSIRPASRSSRCVAAATSVIPWAAGCAGTCPRAATCRP